jgi:hypothetical protein
MKFEATVEVVVYEPPHRLQWTMLDSGHRLHGRYELEAVNGGTRMAGNLVIDPKSPTLRTT